MALVMSTTAARKVKLIQSIIIVIVTEALLKIMISQSRIIVNCLKVNQVEANQAATISLAVSELKMLNLFSLTLNVSNKIHLYCHKIAFYLNY
jgi:hypothetical protein